MHDNDNATADLVLNTPPETLVAHYQDNVARVIQARDLLQGQPIADLAIAGEPATHWSDGDIEQQARAHAWQSLAQQCRASDWMPPEDRKQLDELLYAKTYRYRSRHRTGDPELPPFDLETVTATLERWHGGRFDNLCKLARSLWDRAAQRKSNPTNAWQPSRNILQGYQCERSWSGSYWTPHHHSYFSDLCRVVAVASGSPMPTPEYLSLQKGIPRPLGEWSSLFWTPGPKDPDKPHLTPDPVPEPTPRAEVRGHLNGTLWIRFRPDVLRAMNRLLAGEHPNAVPESKAERNSRKFTA